MHARRSAFGCISLILILATTVCAEESQRGPRGAQQPPARDPGAAETIPDIALEPVFTRLSFTRPVWLSHAGDGTDRVFVIEQPGRIRVFENRPDVSESTDFLDIRERVSMRHNEEGLLALAFHPQYAENGRFYVYYSATEPRRGVLSRFRVSEDDPNRADPDSEEVILEVNQPWGNHNGAMVLFGPDGYLYMSLGDGGHAGDPRNFGQNLSNLLGTIVRIDVDQPSSAQQAGANFRGRSDAPGGSSGTDDADGTDDRSESQPYTIPPDNPFIDREGARPEIWAYGLRNVWRMSFDRETGALWAGDVGQVSSEAVYIIRRGENYGWNITEGSLPHRSPPQGSNQPEDPIVDPIVEYGRRLGISITGGYVYRGQRNPNLQGVYLYGDYGSGRIWGLRYDSESRRMTAHKEVFQQRRRPHITSFGEDEAGELFICAFDDYDGRAGQIFRIVER